MISELEKLLTQQMAALKITIPATEYRFVRDIVGHGVGIRSRISESGLGDWRFDFAWTDIKIAVEIEGGIWSGGRHTRGKGFEEDCRKYNAATLHGWSVYRFTGSQVKSGEAVKFIKSLGWF
jgi:very-short-patch-repair endonuclease